MCACGTDRPRGAALVIVMLVMAVLLLAGTTFLTISSTESQIALNQRASAQALMLAEAGLQKAIAQLNANPSYPGESNTVLGSGSFTVTVAQGAGCTATSARSLVATGTVPVGGGTAQAQIRATADQIYYPYRWAAFAAVPNTVVMWPNQAIFGDDRTESELWLKDGSTTDSFDSSLGAYNATTNRGSGGNIGGNADLTLEDGAQVAGSARAGDALHKGSGVVISGTQVTSLSPDLTSPGETIPPALAQAGPVLPMCQPLSTTCNVPVGTYSIPAGTYSVSSLNIASSAYSRTSITPNGPVTIYVTGDTRADSPASGEAVKLGDYVTLGSDPATQIRIILTSTSGSNSLVKFNAGSRFTLYGSVYGRNANIQLGDRSQIFGAVIGRTMVAHQYSALHFDQAMLNQELCRSDSKYAIRRGTWREVNP